MPINSISPHAANDQPFRDQPFRAPGFGPQSGFVNAAPAYSAPPAQDDVVLALQDRIRRAETAQRVGQGKTVSSGCEAIDRLLPGRGYSPGTLVQWLVPDVLPSAASRGTAWRSADRASGVVANEIQPGGYAADYLSLLSAIEACKDGRSLVVLDPWHQFYPPAVAALGVDMANLIILRSRGKTTAQQCASGQTGGVHANGVHANGVHANGVRANGGQQNSALASGDLYWAIDQSLRCSAVGAVWGPIGSIDQRWFRRFQLSAESSGCLGLFIQSAKEAKQPSWAEVQWLVAGTNVMRSSVASSNDARLKNDRQQRVKLRLLRCRGGKAGRSVEIGVDAVTSQVQQCGGGGS